MRERERERESKKEKKDANYFCPIMLVTFEYKFSILNKITMG